MNQYQLLQIERKDRIFEIILNRPEKHNAFSAEMVTELKNAFKEAAVDQEIRVVVLKANGKSFSAGADLSYLKALQNNSFEENLKDSEHLMELFKQMYEHPKVIIAQVEGHAIAGGCGLATICDFIFAVPEAKFGYTEVKIGFVPAIVMVFLIRKIGEAKARELLLTGKLINATNAKKAGIVYQVVEADKIAANVNEFAITIAEQSSPESIRITREMICNIHHMDTNNALKYAARKNAEARETDDCHKGIAAFLDKQKIKW